MRMEQARLRWVLQPQCSAVQRIWCSAMRSFHLIVECGEEFELEVTIAEAARFQIRFGSRVAVWWHTCSGLGLWLGCCRGRDKVLDLVPIGGTFLLLTYS